MTTTSKVLVTSMVGDTGPHFELLRNAGFEPVVVNRKLDLWHADNLISELREGHRRVPTIASHRPNWRWV